MTSLPDIGAGTATGITTATVLASAGDDLAQLLFMLVLLLPVLGPLGFLLSSAFLVRRLARTGWAPRELASPGALGLVALGAASVAGFAFGWGMMAGFYILDPDELCRMNGLAGDHIVQRTFPVSAQCVTGDALTGGELVPVWVNPAVVAGALVAVAAFVAAVWRRVYPARRDVM